MLFDWKLRRIGALGDPRPAERTGVFLDDGDAVERGKLRK